MAARMPGTTQSPVMGKRNEGRTHPAAPVRHRAADRKPGHTASPDSRPLPAGSPHSPGAPPAAHPGARARVPIPTGAAPHGPGLGECALAALVPLLPGTAWAASGAPGPLPWLLAGALAGVAATLLWSLLRRRARPAPAPLPDATSVLEALPCAAFLKDADGSYLAVNRAFEAQYQCRRQDVIGRGLADLRGIHGVDTDTLLQAEGRVHQSGQAIACEITRGTAEASRTLRLRLHPLPGPDGIRAVLGTMADVTELHEARRATEAATHTAGTFLSLISHEIRTPIAGALGLVELLAHTPLDQEQLQMLGMLEESVEGLLEILGDILDFSRLQAGELQLDSGAFDLRALVDEVTAAAATPARDKGLRLHACVDGTLAARHQGDAARLRQVLAYLLARALRCTCAGQVELHVAVAGGGAQVQRLRLSVSDPGVGAAPAQLARTVEPQATDGTRPGGLALGLAICRHLVQLMQGELLLSSVEGEGNLACLELELPVDLPQQPAPALRGRIALACTADPRTGHALAQALAALGLEPLEATPSGIGRVDRGDADLFLADAALVRAGRLPAHARPVCLLDPDDPLPAPEGCIVLPVAPLLWRNLVPACHAALGLPAPDAHGPPQPPREAVRILVAEDHPINRAVIARQLQRLGYPHDTVGDGDQALQALSAARYDLLVTDCHMPGMDGYTLVRHLRVREQERGLSRLPVIALSASVLPGHVRRCLEAGMDDFLAKPVQLQDLELKLTRHLGMATPPAGDETPASTDSAAYRQLALLMEAYGSLRQVREVLQGLLDTGREDLAALDQAFARGDTRSQHELLHRISGSLRLVGEPPDAPTGAPADLAARRDALHRHMRWLETLLQGLGPPATAAPGRR